MEKTIHHGRNVKRFREMFGLKQEALAYELGDDWNQQKISLLEQKEVIDDTLLADVAKVLKVPVDAFKHFDENEAMNIIGNTFNDEASAVAKNYKCTFNPLDKLMEQVDKNEKLYQQLLKEKDEKIALMERFLQK